MAAYWASQWATEKGKLGDISSTLSKAAKLADYLRYAFFDKHFKQVITLMMLLVYVIFKIVKVFPKGI